MTTTCENKGIRECLDQMNAISLSFPDWFARYEDAQISFDMSNDEVFALLESAPSDFAAGVLFGKMCCLNAFNRV